MTEAGDAKTTCRPSQRILAHRSIFKFHCSSSLSQSSPGNTVCAIDITHSLWDCRFRSLLQSGVLCDVHFAACSLACTSTFTLDPTPSLSFTHSTVLQTSIHWGHSST